MTEREAEQAYDDYLDECDYDTVLFHIPLSEAVKELDPTQYDCGFADFCDAEDIEFDESEEQNGS